uniref:DNA 5'-3' helicase n=1 Tax=Glossina palpalis gambiensis TaxID=67801 RepID=A0A1B0B910_9MUSC
MKSIIKSKVLVKYLLQSTMYARLKSLQTPADFEFPFAPYTIQKQLMQELFEILENKQIGIFESPTGTGKSLTLTCAALKWLEQHENHVRREIQERLDEVGRDLIHCEKENREAIDWFSLHSKSHEKRRQLLELKDMKKLLDEYDQRLAAIKENENIVNYSNKKTRNKLNQISMPDIGDTEENLYSLDEAEADESVDTEGLKTSQSYQNVQIFFCSRTHAQLAQVMKEIKRTPYGRRVRCLSLASRQQLCINPQVRKLNNSSMINERCLDLAKENKGSTKVTASDGNGCACKKASVSPKSSKGGCPYKAQTLVKNLSELAVMNNFDIEDLVQEGERLQTCPYYAARSSVPIAQIVLLPYQLLFNHKSRDQIGINLKGNIIIIDEAHNLLDTLAQMYSCEISLEQLATLQQQMQSYKLRYANKFSSANLLYINQLLFVIKRLIKLLKPSQSPVSKTNHRMICTYELMSEGDFFNIDLYQLLQFCERTRFAQKLQGFIKKLEETPQPKENQFPRSSTVDILKRLEKKQQIEGNKKNLESHALTQEDEALQAKVPQEKKSFITSLPIRFLITFLEALIEKAEDGRILINIEDKSSKDVCHQSGFKYILLNPGAHFKYIVKEARAIIVAGGTMQPTFELTEQLFSSCPERVKLHFYDHVVSSDAVLPFAITQGPSGKNLCFNYSQRAKVEALSDISAILENLCNVVPAGLVCFLPSYDYLDTIYNHLQTCGALERISKRKRVFKESRSSTNKENCSVEELLDKYASSIKIQREGALLLSVVGGKLSEGLNFSDDLGRGVIVVGLPYPNRQAPEMQERLKYLDSTLGSGSGNEYYENLCMKAVNQCIGRAVRHIGDFACVYLVDVRYANQNIQTKLPQWISRHLQVTTSYGQVQARTVKFFKTKNKN